MSHFAEISGSNNIVTRVIVAEQDFIDSGAVGAGSNWVQTSYNTRGGVHHCGGIEYVTEPVEAVDAVLYTDKDILPDGKEVGDVMIPAVEAVEAVYVEGKSPEDVGKPDGGVALRKNYAGVGYTYNSGSDAFIAPQPPNFVSSSLTFYEDDDLLPSYISNYFAQNPSGSIPYILNEDSCLWELSGSGS